MTKWSALPKFILVVTGGLLAYAIAMTVMTAPASAETWLEMMGRLLGFIAETLSNIFV